EVFFNLLHADATEELHRLAGEISSIYAEFGSDVSLDLELFEQIKSVYDSPPKNLTSEQKMLLKKSYLGFVRNGARLNDSQKEKLRAIDQEMSKLGPQFSEFVIKDSAKFELLVTDSKNLNGVPESAVESAKQLAETKSKSEGWLFNLEMPSYVPFLTYCPNRELREKMWRAYGSRSMSGEFATKDIINKIVNLRHERAKLLGYKSHADYVLEERMAKSASQVFNFLEELLKPSRPSAEKDLDMIRKKAKELDGISDLKQWDVNYYMEKLKLELYDLDEEELRPYLPLNSCVEGAFKVAEKLYGLKFKKRTDIPVYHPEVETFEVTDAKTGEYVSLFYTDFFPRPTKKTGAWMTQFRSQGLWKGKVRRPHVSIVCNFTKPTPTKPSLITFSELETLFHEFGHALHGMLSQCRYPSLASPNVHWDFVELPSQFMENFLREKEVLDLFAHHYKTNETIPNELFAKLKRSEQYMKGYMSLRQLNFGILDMAWHNSDPGYVQDIEEFEKKHTSQTSLLPHISGTAQSPAFSHIFAGGYSAGYYSYKWAEVLDADAFEYFKEKGLFDPTVADKFKNSILARGGTIEPDILYREFRGKDADPKALLRRDGLI
ncbi:MAG: M3 family metallopeptidase, partial [Bdellovibrionales bacterium]|nr:M3 family metallopeptidase [Bdellovibrionales bacterium]